LELPLLITFLQTKAPSIKGLLWVGKYCKKENKVNMSALCIPLQRTHKLTLFPFLQQGTTEQSIGKRVASHTITLWIKWGGYHHPQWNINMIKSDIILVLSPSSFILPSSTLSISSIQTSKQFTHFPSLWASGGYVLRSEKQEMSEWIYPNTPLNISVQGLPVSQRREKMSKLRSTEEKVSQHKISKKSIFGIQQMKTNPLGPS